MPRSFFGGVHPKGHKELSRDAALTVIQPKTVSIAMSQHIGAPCKPLVAVGQHVTVGQKVGDGAGLCAPVHASVSGTVIAVEERPHPGGTPVLSVVIANDGRDDLSPDIHPRESIADLDAQALIDLLHEAGITGMGGAGFPTHFKLSSGLGKVDTVIVNGAECEPYITADDRLMRETPERVMGGLRIIRKILQPERTAIGIEANKPEAIAAMRTVLDDGVELLPLRVRYPQGAEKQLIQSVAGRCVPPGGLPASVGCAVFNAATCAAIHDAIYEGLPLVRRAVTVTGSAVAHPGNFLAPIGTPFSELIEAAGGFACAPYKILCGGPMMGLAQYTIDAMTIKGCNAITCLAEKDRRKQAAQHCIRCGKCVENCPMHLMPLFMHKASAAGKVERLKELHVADCIECGCCAYGCPAGIPLVQSFRTAKRLLRDAAAREKEAAK